jgi:cation diffusion facilitator CzcD-associated flavoprotein CzcO
MWMSMTVDTHARPAGSGRTGHRFVIIGAGMAGILSAIKLREAGLDDFTVYEKADRLGGTWRENEYPGIACDVPSHLYSYSFAPNPDWSQQFSRGSEICAYLENVARRYGVYGDIRYGTEITRCTYDGGRWILETAEGRIDEADFVIAATGVLHHPNVPTLQGLESFGGLAFHSARWNRAAKTAGMRVGIIGTGSTATQIVTALVDEVAELVLFQRTPQWIMPMENHTYTDEEKATFRSRPEVMAEMRGEIARAFKEGFANVVVDADAPMLQMIQYACQTNLEEKVRDPELREKLRPNYRAACKRLVLSESFYEAIQRPHAKLVTERIERIEKSGVRTIDGQLHALDVLVLATGFHVDSFMRPMEVVGRGGVGLDCVWQDGPRAYLAISVPDFPNFFMLNGPNGPVGNFSLIDVAELQFAYIMQLVDLVRGGACKEVSASWAAMDRFDAERKEAAQTTIWKSGCNSWYLDRNGVPMAWPWTFDRFLEEMRRPRLEDFETR